MPGQRTFAGGGLALELDGKKVGPLRSASGGDAVADVVEEASPKGYYAKKHIANLRWTPLEIAVGAGMGEPLLSWIAATLTGTGGRKNGAVVETDANGNVRARREFTDALLTEVSIPASDGGSKEPAYLTLALAPEQVTTTAGSGKSSPLAKQKLWTAANFKLELDGLDTTKVAKVDGFTITQTVAAAKPGARVKKEPTKLEFPNLRVTLAAASAQTWFAWFDDFVLKGKSGDAKERNGTLRFLAPNLKDELGQVRFFNVGIFGLAAEASAATAIKRVVADLYCERMELDAP